MSQAIFSYDPKSKSDSILMAATEGKRITPDEALLLYKEADYLKVMSVARFLRDKVLSHEFASYTGFRVVNYTNYCNVECSFCSFMDEIGSGKGYNLSEKEIIEKMDYFIFINTNQPFIAYENGIIYGDLYQKNDIKTDAIHAKLIGNKKNR